MADPQTPEVPAARRAVPAEQRVFSLVLALVASPQGLTKRDVLSVVYGYSDRYRPGQSDASLDRQFERDKDQLRKLGIPVEAIDSPLEPGNNQLTRYRIQKRLLQMPAEARFTARELALLRLAALAWGEGSLTAESRRSAMKLEALGAGLDVQYLGIAPSLGISEPSAPALQRAIADGESVTFAYQLPDRDAPLRRRVAPLRLHRAEGRWHLIAHDLDRGSERVFLLSRIVGPVRIEAVASVPAEIARTAQDRADAVLEELERLSEAQRASVVARRGSQAEARLAGRAGAVAKTGAVSGSERRAGASEGSARVEFGTLDYRELALELAGFGEQLAVLDPPSLRGDVVTRLRTVREQHASADPDGEAGDA